MKFIILIFTLLLYTACQTSAPNSTVQDWSKPPAGCPATYCSGDTIDWTQDHHVAKECNRLLIIRDSAGCCTAVGITYPPAP